MHDVLRPPTTTPHGRMPSELKSFVRNRYPLRFALLESLPNPK